MKRTTHVQSTALYNILQNSTGRAHTHTHLLNKEWCTKSWNHDTLMYWMLRNWHGHLEAAMLLTLAKPNSFGHVWSNPEGWVLQDQITHTYPIFGFLWGSPSPVLIVSWPLWRQLASKYIISSRPPTIGSPHLHLAGAQEPIFIGKLAPLQSLHFWMSTPNRAGWVM